MYWAIEIEVSYDGRSWEPLTEGIWIPGYSLELLSEDAIHSQILEVLEASAVLTGPNEMHSNTGWDGDLYRMIARRR